MKKYLGIPNGTDTTYVSVDLIEAVEIQREETMCNEDIWWITLQLTDGYIYINESFNTKENAETYVDYIFLTILAMHQNKINVNTLIYFDKNRN